MRFILSVGRESKMSDKFIFFNLMENQFINAPLLVHRQPPSVDPKDELIKALELKNSKLKTELLKIQRTMQQKFQGQDEQQGPKKRQSIFQWEESLEVLNKELANSYKKIKMYEYQISKLQKDSGNKATVTQKSTQIEHIVKEKRAMTEKLKQELIKQQKLTQENMRKLQNNSQKDENEVYLKKITEEAKFYKQKIKFLQKKQSMKAANMKKQYQMIKKFENELLQAGLAGGELEEIKHRAIRNINNGKKSIMNETGINKQQANVTNTNSDEQIQDKTRDHYQVLMGEIALLQKMQSDHQKQFIKAEEDKEEAIRKNMASRNKLIQCQNEIQNLQKDIAVIKSRVIPSNLKPLNPLRSLSSHQGDNPQKILPVKQGIKNKGLTHLLKFDQIGQSSSKGQRFTDRTVLGKSNLSAKITGIKVFFQRVSGLFGGIQVTYDGKKKGGEYVRKDKQAKQKQYNQQQFVCKGNASIRSISGTMSPDDKLQSLLVTSSDGNNHKFGVAKTTQKHFNFDINSEEFPTCVFGSLFIVKELGKKEYSLIEHFGFEIQNLNMNSHSALLNEFNE